MRVALGNGIHTSMPVEQLSGRLVERCRGIWWTVYVVDREMTLLMSLPQSINDDDVQSELPSFLGSPQWTPALRMQTRLSQTIATIGRGELRATPGPRKLMASNYRSLWGGWQPE